MALSRLIVHHFRNIDYAELECSPHFNFIVGNNGSGKTSLLEAIYTLGHGRAFRHSQANRIIQHEEPELVVHGNIKHAQIHYQVGLSKTRDGSNKIRLNGSDNHKIAELAKLLPIQLITPEGFTLLNGGPKYRRAFLDWGCFHMTPSFYLIWSHIKRLLKQRNAALKQTHRYQDIQVWDQQLIVYAQQISEWRCHYVDKIKHELLKTCHDFLPEYKLTCQFYQGWETNINYADILQRNFERDKQLSYTSAGPHKADLRLKINNIPVEDLLSRGQLKLLMCALRLAQGEHFTQQTQRPCLYLIDDFASELDLTKRKLLSTRLKTTQSQVFITAIDAEQISDIVDENDKKFHIVCGKIAP